MLCPVLKRSRCHSDLRATLVHLTRNKQINGEQGNPWARVMITAVVGLFQSEFEALFYMAKGDRFRRRT